jgi:hypothetical protein
MPASDAVPISKQAKQKNSRRPAEDPAPPFSAVGPKQCLTFPS